jgi:hypothetical protein
MNAIVGTWLLFRCARWACWLGFIGYAIEFVFNRPSHLNSFGHLLPTTEFWMFVLPLVAIFTGMIELMMRERAGLERPPFGRRWLA